MPHFFTNRRNGSSIGAFESLNFGFHVGDDENSVKANRSLLPNTQFMEQIHSDRIVEVDHLSNIDPICDGLITTTPGISLAVMVADCIPLLLISKSVVAAVHVGRAGLVNNIALKTLHRMKVLGAIDVKAILGPSICGSCYEVPIQMQVEVGAKFPTALAKTRSGSPSLNLSGALMTELVEHGVDCEVSPICTMENELYFSHRRDKPTGRFAGVISL